MCEQEPQPGETIAETPRLTVDRDCEDDTEPEATPEPEPSPTEEESQPATSETPEVSESAAPSDEPEQPLTIATNSDLKKVLAERDNCSDVVSDFASEYEGQVIDFDGNVAAMANHGDYDTRYDILIYPGDYSETSATGPSFQFRDVNVFDLKFTGPKKPKSIGPGDNLRFVATVGKFDDNSCLFFLDPVATMSR